MQHWLAITRTHNAGTTHTFNVGTLYGTRNFISIHFMAYKASFMPNFLENCIIYRCMNRL